MSGIQKHEFHTVLYISFNFCLEFSFSNMAHCPFPWDGGSQTLHFCAGLAISCNFQKNVFLVNWVQTPCGDGGMKNMSFAFH